MALCGVLRRIGEWQALVVGDRPAVNARPSLSRRSRGSADLGWKVEAGRAAACLDFLYPAISTF
jgi:hypothetical protein